MGTLNSLLPALVGLLGASTVLWVASLVLRDSSIVDIFWGLGFLGVAIFYSTVSGPSTQRGALILALVLIWGVRLSVYLAYRNIGRQEDFRYQAMRDSAGWAWPLVSLFKVFWLQALLLWAVSLPLYAAQRGYSRSPLGWVDFIGLLVWGLGFLFEAVGDFQLARFKKDPENEGKVLDTGLWKYTRHPNYFGDCLVWWGFGIIALATPNALWSLVGPAVMTVLLMKVSGVTLLERNLVNTKVGYLHYTDKTPAFFPWFPR